MTDAEFDAELNDGLRTTLGRMRDWSFEQAGMEWWNALGMEERRERLDAVGTNASVADAYSAYLRDKYPAEPLGTKSPCCGLQTTPEYRGQEITYDVCPCGQKRLR